MQRVVKVIDQIVTINVSDFYDEPPRTNQTICVNTNTTDVIFSGSDPSTYSIG